MHLGECWGSAWGSAPTPVVDALDDVVQVVPLGVALVAVEHLDAFVPGHAAGHVVRDS